MNEIKIVSESGFLIPIKDISKESIESAQKKCLYRFYRENACAKCEYLEDRHSENCDSCQAFIGARQTVKKVVYKGAEYLSIPRGRRQLAINVASKDDPKRTIRVVSGDKSKEMSRPIRLMTDFEIRSYQNEAVEVAITKRRGILKSPPRSGKTLMGAMISCKVGKKTIILASQREWLVQFKETFYGSKTQRGFTTAKPGQVDFARTIEQFEKTDVCLCTFSQFMSEKGKALLTKIRDMFAVVIIDEVHKSPALASSRVLSGFNARYVIGLSGTPDRKVTEEMKVAFDLVGPVIYESKVERLRPIVELMDTPGEFEYNAKMGKAALPNLQSKLENNKPRRLAIIKKAIKYANAGHLVMIPLTRVAAILEWTRLINEMTETKAFAVPFYGGVPKDVRVSVMDRLRRYKSRIVVGNIAMLSTGLNIPRASCLFEVAISSNLPNAQQRFARVLTPMEGKPDPVIVFSLDECDFMKTCRRNEFWNALVPHYNPKIDPTVKSRLLDYFANKGGGRASVFKEV